MRQALAAAQHGDSSAQFYIGKLLQLCAGMPVEMSVMKAIAESKSAELPQSLVEKRESQATQCALLLQDTEIFAALPQREGGYPADYWLRLSAQQGNSSASADIARRAVRERQVHGMEDDPVGANRPFEEAERSLQQAIANSGGDAEALFLIGETLFNARREDADDRQLRGAAWMLVACERGYDCTLANDKNEMARALAVCHGWQDPNCPDGSDVTQYIRNLGQENFNKARALAKQFSRALDNSDIDELLRSVSVK
jgi:TPR repeat protein